MPSPCKSGLHILKMAEFLIERNSSVTRKNEDPSITPHKWDTMTLCAFSTTVELTSTLKIR
ncbi:uncharacterized protein LOC111064366 isoform X3 [Nilaparvata lugens]|uniref:uncharacterized protein LOC111064366 isoform X3 n=1 Tax=Nilaparvata lugens TaxID=108931 RepID=UPI00193E7BC8|nr:uncharacterized protein LOC111064366 isoform X3 [Nilaparvata lugens]